MKLVDEIRADKAKHPRLYEEAAKGYRNFTELADRAGVSYTTAKKRLDKGWIPKPLQPKSNNNHLANATKMMNNTDPSPHIPPKQQDTVSKPMSIPNRKKLKDLEDTISYFDTAIDNIDKSIDDAFEIIEGNLNAIDNTSYDKLISLRSGVSALRTSWYTYRDSGMEDNLDSESRENFDDDFTALTH